MRRPEVIVIDLGSGNLLSVQRGLEYCGAKVVVTSDPKTVLSAKKVVLPGVGAFGNAMEALHRLDLVTAIRELSLRKTQLLGICLGMQLLLDESEEFSITKGLGLIPGRVIPVPRLTMSGTSQKIPHIGWNELQPSHGSDTWKGTLLQANRPGDAVYFVHSFMAVPEFSSHRLADCSYGGCLISAVIGTGPITGCQFHPEKSGEVGLKLLRQFVAQ